jgi:hypothetical protein
MKTMRISALSVALPVVFFSLAAGALDQPNSTRLSSLPAAAQPDISAALGRDLLEYHVQAANTGFSAANPNQNLSMRFTADGLEVRQGSARWGMTLLGYGYGDDLATMAARPATQAGVNRVEYRRGSLTEWYVNGPVGLEQGFTISQPPSQANGRPLTVALELSGPVDAVVDEGAKGLTLSRSNQGTLRYTGLIARDASGKELRAWLELKSHRLLLRVADSGARYPLLIDPWLQLAKLTASNGAAGDSFGWSVGVSGNTVVVGAPNATVNGVRDQGAAYVFQAASGWSNMTQTAILTSLDPANLFGTSVSIDGNTVAVGSAGSNHYQGAVYVYLRPPTGWVNATQSAKLTASDAATLAVLGDSVSVSGNTIVAGSPGVNISQGAVYVFVEPPTGWTRGTETAKLTASDGVAGDGLGVSVGISGNTVVAGAAFAKFGADVDRGTAYVYVQPTAGWVTTSTFNAKLAASDGKPDDELGFAAAISNSVIALGAPYHNTGGAAYVFVQPAQGWTGNLNQTAELTAGITQPWQFGNSVGTNGGTVVVGSPLAQAGTLEGAAYVFNEPLAGWATTTTPSATLIASDEGTDEFGVSVSVNSGSMAAGSPMAKIGSNLKQGAAYVFGTNITTFEGVDGSSASPADVDPSGAVGTLQFMEWTNGGQIAQGLQAFDKTTLAPLWTPPGHDIAWPWETTGMKDCEYMGGDGQIVFDHLASRWVIGAHNSGNQDGQNWFYCMAVSSTDDLSSPSLTWYTYKFFLNPLIGTNSLGQPMFPDWPKLGTWQDGYYATLDIYDQTRKYIPVGVLVCALDRTNMLLNKAAGSQCFTDPPVINSSSPYYLGHSIIPADIQGKTPPPAGRDEFLVGIQNPPYDMKTTTSNTVNLWDFHVDWKSPVNTKLSKTSLTVPTYTPGCYNAKFPLFTNCVPEPSSSKTQIRIDSVGDRLMPNMPYRNFGSYESFVISHTVQPGTNKQTGIRWYELRCTGCNGNTAPTLNLSGNLAFDASSFRFVPSIAEDKVGNAAAGYSISGAKIHPSITTATWSLIQNTKPSETILLNGPGDLEVAGSKVGGRWGSYTSMTVDPVDDCTFWYVNQYFATTQTTSPYNWNTSISKFSLPNCQ